MQDYGDDPAGHALKLSIAVTTFACGDLPAVFASNAATNAVRKFNYQTASIQFNPAPWPC